MSAQTCPLCLSGELSEVLYTDHNALVSIAQIKSQPGSLASSPIELIQCKNCGFIFNSAFDKEKTLAVYSSQDYVVKSVIPGKMSKTIESIHDSLAEFVNSDSRILEIGSGQADLALALGKKCKTVVTMDPSVQMHLQNLPPEVNHVHIQKYFSHGAAAAYAPFNLIFFRHLLEHIPEPGAFLKDVAQLTALGGIVYIEVPNWQNVIENERFCDIFNDHFGYYQEATLKWMMQNLGFSLEKSTMNFGGQHMGLFFKKTTDDNQKNSSPTMYSARDFQIFYQHSKQLNSIFDEANKVIVWGAGAHGESILSCLSEKNRAKIKFYFDKDKNKLNKFIPNTQAEIIYPAKDILEQAVDLVLISAVLYEDEINEELKNQLGYKGKIVKIGRGTTLQ